jgi:hypothetical protein
VTPASQPFVLSPEQYQADLRAAEEAAFRRAQGLYESGRTNFEQKVQGELASLKNFIEVAKLSGKEITPQDEQQMRQNVIARAYETAQPATPPGQPQLQAPEGNGDDADPVTLAAWEMMKEVGVDIEDNDPEVRLIVDNGTPLQFIRSVEKAIAAKQARTGATGNQPPAVQPHVPTNAGGGGAPAYQQLKPGDQDARWEQIQSNGRL